MATLLDRIKSGEVTKVVSNVFGVCESIYIQEVDSHPIHIYFPQHGYKDFTSKGQYFLSKPDICDIYPYNDQSEVQPEQSELHNLVEWILTTDKISHTELWGKSANELINEFKQSRCKTE